jgi:hypothetical protein
MDKNKPEDKLKLTKEQKKMAILAYLEYAPIYKYASMSVGITDETLKAWRDEDEEFSHQCEARISEFVTRTVRRTKPEFQLERMLRDFSPRTELTGAEGKDLPTPILGGIKQDVSENNSDNKDTSTQ